MGYPEKETVIGKTAVFLINYARYVEKIKYRPNQNTVENVEIELRKIIHSLITTIQKRQNSF